MRRREPDAAVGSPGSTLGVLGCRAAPGDARGDLPDPAGELDAGRAALRAGSIDEAVLRFGLALRLAPALAPAVLEATDGVRGPPPINVVRGDAYRQVGLETEARAGIRRGGVVRVPRPPGPVAIRPRPGDVREPVDRGRRRKASPDAAGAAGSPPTTRRRPGRLTPPGAIRYNPAIRPAHRTQGRHARNRTNPRPDQARRRPAPARRPHPRPLRGARPQGRRAQARPRRPRLAERHYAAHRAKPFFGGLVDFIISAPLVALALDGPNAIAVVRAINGATRPHEAAPGTVRGDFALETAQNIVHASDGPEAAAEELALWFSPAELLDYERDVDRWVLAPTTERGPTAGLDGPGPRPPRSELDGDGATDGRPTFRSG